MNTKNTSKIKRVLLPSVAEIRSGHNFRGRIETDMNGLASVVQLGDLEEGRPVQFANLTKVSLGDLPAMQLLREGDVLVRARGGSVFPASFIDACPGPCVAAFPILVLRPNQEKVLPAFLMWMLNQQRVQAQLQALAQSTTVPTISKASLSVLEILLPPLEVQKRVVGLSTLLDQEQQLLSDILQKRRWLANKLLMQYAEDSKLSVGMACLLKGSDSAATPSEPSL